MRISKQFCFDSAHFLPGYIGKCQNLHGHRWLLEVIINGKIEDDGMVIDFTQIKSIVENNIINKLDHNLLNNFLLIPTAENIGKYIFTILRDIINKEGVKLYSIKIWETPTSCVEVFNEDL